MKAISNRDREKRCAHTKKQLVMNARGPRVVCARCGKHLHALLPSQGGV